MPERIYYRTMDELLSLAGNDLVAWTYRDAIDGDRTAPGASRTMFVIPVVYEGIPLNIYFKTHDVTGVTAQVRLEAYFKAGSMGRFLHDIAALEGHVFPDRIKFQEHKVSIQVMKDIVYLVARGCMSIYNFDPLLRHEYKPIGLDWNICLPSNDVFNAESVCAETVLFEEVTQVRALYDTWGETGVIAWMAWRHYGRAPLQRHITPEYYAARKHLESAKHPIAFTDNDGSSIVSKCKELLRSLLNLVR